MKPILKRHIASALTEEFIFMLSEYFPTSELVIVFRPLNKLFNNTLKVYLPTRL